MAQGRKKNSRRRGVKPSERAAAQAQRQNEKAERKDRIQHILVVAFAVIMALGMLIPSLAAIFGGNDQAQQITDSEGNEVTALTAFTPLASSGMEMVSFKLDARELKGHTIVAFEELVENANSITGSILRRNFSGFRRVNTTSSSM